MLHTIGRKLGFGFGLLLVLMGASAIVAYVMTNNLVNKAIPVDVNCNKLIDGIDRSLSAVPAYVILGGESFREKLAIKQIEQSTHNLQSLSIELGSLTA